MASTVGVRYAASFSRSEAGKSFAGAFCSTDIDDRKRAENALRESERESRLIVDSIPGFIAAFTPGGEVEFVNRPTLEVLRQDVGGAKALGDRRRDTS